MARKTETVVSMLDDVDGSKAVETVTFSLDGTRYELDLSAKNAKAIRSDFSRWTPHARRARGAASRSRRRRSPARATSNAAAIRAWATENGIAVPARGRIPAAVAEQYASR